MDDEGVDRVLSLPHQSQLFIEAPDLLPEPLMGLLHLLVLDLQGGPLFA